jgi:DtxR family manganese transport transcriptional regulator
MPTPNESSVSHRRTRRDHATETAEDYVEAIAETHNSAGTCRVRDLAIHFGVSHVTVTRIVSRLQGEGLVTTAPYRPIELTPQGKRLATASRKRHETVFRFLVSLGIDREIAAIDAEGMEHHVSPQTLKRFAELADKNAASPD